MQAFSLAVVFALCAVLSLASTLSWPYHTLQYDVCWDQAFRAYIYAFCVCSVAALSSTSQSQSQLQLVCLWCVQDTDDMDYLLPQSITELGNCLMQLAATLIFVSIVQPIFLAGTHSLTASTTSAWSYPVSVQHSLHADASIPVFQPYLLDCLPCASCGCVYVSSSHP